jgi:ribonuclease HI
MQSTAARGPDSNTNRCDLSMHRQHLSNLGLRGTASDSSQWAFLQCQEIMNTRPNVEIRWAPGHTNIEGNEAADSLADAEAKEPSAPFGQAAQPTVSGIRYNYYLIV